MPDDAFLQQSLATVSQKLDQIIRDLPERYVDRQSYEKRHESLERRVDTLENDVRKINEVISNLHNNSMAFVNEALSGLERRILDKMEASAASSRSQWIMLAVAGVGWLLSIAGLLVAIFK